MIIENKYFPSPKFWHPNFIQDSVDSYPDKVIATMIWHHDSKIIIKQLRDAIKSNVDIILSELLPDELPDSVLTIEYNFFINHFQYIPPQFLTDLTFSNNINIDHTPLLVVNNEQINQNENESNCNSIHNVLKIVQKIRLIQVIDIHSDDLVNAISGSSKVITYLPNPQENIAVSMLAKRMLKPLAFLNNNTGSPLRYLSMGITPEENFSYNEKSIREILTNQFFKKNTDSYKNQFCSKTLNSFVNKYDKQTFFLVLNSLNSQWFSKEIYQNDTDKEIWNTPWILDMHEKSFWNIIIRTRFQRKITHTILYKSPRFILNDTEERQIFDIYQKRIRRDFIYSFVSSKATDAWHLELLYCIRVYDGWLDDIKDLITKWYKHDQKPKEVFSKIGTSLVIISAKDINSELKAKIMRSAEEFMNKDLIFSRLKNNSKYALNHLIFRKGIEGNNNLISEFSDKIDTFRSQSFALQSYLELLPIILNPDDILSIFNKIQSSSLAYHNLYNALLNGIFYSTGLIVYQDILFITEDAQNKNSILRDKLTLLNNLKANNQELAHEHILLLFLFDRKKSVEMMLNGKNLINRLACAWHLCFHGCDEAKVMFNKVKVEEVKNNFDWFIRHLANACLLNMESFVKKNIVKYSENFPDHYEGRIEIKNNPGLHFKHLLVMSFLGRSAQFNNHRRLSESLFPDHFFWMNSTLKRIKNDSTLIMLFSYLD